MAADHISSTFNRGGETTAARGRLPTELALLRRTRERNPY